MDLRSIKPGLAAVSHPLFYIHPRTGEMVTPLGWAEKSGKPIWPMMGGAPDDDDTSGDDDDESEEDDDEDEGEESDEDNDESDDDESDDDDEKGQKGKKKKKGDPKARIKALEEEKERHYKKAKKEKARADDLEARLKALEEKNLKPEEVQELRKKEQEARDAANNAATRQLVLENAFLRANDIDWVKPSQALALLLADDDYEVEFDSDGKVNGKSLKAELKRLAKANPHLVKKAKTESADDNNDADGGTGSKSTAPSMNKRKGKANTPTREELAKRFPALNRH